MDDKIKKYLEKQVTNSRLSVDLLKRVMSFKNLIGNRDLIDAFNVTLTDHIIQYECKECKNNDKNDDNEEAKCRCVKEYVKKA